MEFAIVQIAGKQYLVKDGQTLQVEANLEGQKSLSLTNILPVGKSVPINAEVLSVKKGEKIQVSKFKAKSRYRRSTGFRPFVTTLKIKFSPKTKKS